jgi:hypothetical protein
MYISRYIAVTALLLVFTGCGGGVEVTSGAGSSHLCYYCTEIGISNRTAFPIVVSGSGKDILLYKNQVKRLKYGESHYGESVTLYARKADSKGHAIGPAVSRQFSLYGGSYTWELESYMFR